MAEGEREGDHQRKDDGVRVETSIFSYIDILLVDNPSIDISHSTFCVSRFCLSTFVPVDVFTVDIFLSIFRHLTFTSNMRMLPSD
jgi:hypothetical protein